MARSTSAPLAPFQRTRAEPRAGPCTAASPPWRSRRGPAARRGGGDPLHGVREPHERRKASANSANIVREMINFDYAAQFSIVKFGVDNIACHNHIITPSVIK